MNTKIKAGSELKWNKNNMIIICNFNMNCNFKCSYCINQNTRKKYSTQLSQKALYNLISNLPHLNKDFYSFAIAGGEPSLYQHFPEMLQYMKEFIPQEKFQAYCATNGSLLHIFEKNLANYQDMNFHISVSMHLEQMNAEQYLTIFSKFKFPQMCRIKIMLEPGTMNQTNYIIEKAKSFGYDDFIIQPLTINAQIHPDYSQEEKAFFKNNPYAAKVNLFNEYKTDNGFFHKDFTKDEFVLNPELVNYAGLQCLAGYNSIRVLADGKITPCYYQSGDPDFNLNTHSLLEYKPLYTPVTCHAKYCGCHGFTALPKWNPEYCQGPDYFINSKVKQ